MDAARRGLYQDYLKFADNLENQLVATYGQEKATRFFQRMDRSRFEAICDAAPGDALKRQWLSWLQEQARRLDARNAERAA
jgi:hypothetical protein